ncbi:MAG: SpoIIE family protein phosphatase [Chitinivibrionales bacterium]
MVIAAAIISQSIIIIVCIVVIIRLMQSRRIKHSKHQLESTFDSIDSPTATITEHYTIQRVNKAYAEMIGKDYKEILGRKCFEILRSRTSICEDCRMMQTLETGKQQHIATSSHPKSTGRIVSFTFYPFSGSSQKDRFVVEHIRDVTELESIRSDLERRNAMLANTTNILTKAKQEMDEKLDLARQVQQSTLPEKAPAIKGLMISHIYHPVEAVGGDVYDFIPFTQDRVGIFIGDASGHGLAAALVSTISKMSLFSHTRTELGATELLENINRDLVGNLHERAVGHYLTCFWGVFDNRDNSFTYARAGHPQPIVIRANGERMQLDAAGTFAGIIENTRYEQKKFHFKKGDRCYLCTDGIYEVNEDANGTSTMLGYKRFAEVVASVNNQPFDNILPALSKRLSGFSYEDDFTVIVFEVTEDRPQDLSEDFPGFRPEDDIALFTIHTPSSVEQLIEPLSRRLTHNGFIEDTIKKIEICINELVSNGFEHGNGNDDGKKVTVAYTISRSEAKICVVDEGSGFNLESIPDPTHPENIAREGGRGVHLIRSFADEYGQNTKGNGIYFVKQNTPETAS